MKKFLIIAPFWNNPRHVGAYRLNRIVGWLTRKNVPVVLIKAGPLDGVQPGPLGPEISIRDTLGFFKDTHDQLRPGGWSRLFYLPARWLARRVLLPDPGILWALRVAAHPLVAQHVADVTHVVASNPPESPHLAAAFIARRLRAHLVVDMRDGWLDEPLRPMLQRSRLRRRCEAVIEKHVLRRARHIFVTSDVWREMLVARLPAAKCKTVVLTNAYPPSHGKSAGARSGPTTDRRSGRRLTLTHVGRFTGSSNSRRPARLLKPLLEGVRGISCEGDLVMLGDLTAEDLAEAKSFGAEFASVGWRVSAPGPVSRKEALQFINSADGLLLLSTSHAAIPSKLFEYIATAKPILALAPADSAVWRLGQRLVQMHVVDYTGQKEDQRAAIARFVDACACGVLGDIPAEFSDAGTSQIFYSALAIE